MSWVEEPFDLWTWETIRQRWLPVGDTIPADVFVVGPRRSAGSAHDRDRRPALPARDTAWPKHRGRPMTFVAQFGFHDSRDLVGKLPGDVLLVFAPDRDVLLDVRRLHTLWVRDHRRVREATDVAQPAWLSRPLARLAGESHARLERGLGCCGLVSSPGLVTKRERQSRAAGLVRARKRTIFCSTLLRVRHVPVCDFLVPIATRRRLTPRLPTSYLQDMDSSASLDSAHARPEPSTERIGVAHRPTRRHGRLAFALPLAAIVVATRGLGAQQLIGVSGPEGQGKVMERFDPSAVNVSPRLASTALSAIPIDESVRGITPINGPGTTPNQVFVYTEFDEHHIWKVDHVTGSATLGCSPLAWRTNGRPAAEVVGFARTRSCVGSAQLCAGVFGAPPPFWHLIVAADGALTYPTMCDLGAGLGNSSGTTGQLPFPGPYLGAVQHGGSLYVTTQANQTWRLHQVRLAYQTFQGPVPPTQLRVWDIPLSTASQVLGFTVSSDGRVYAYLNRVGSWIGHGWGHLELAGSNETLDAPGTSLTFTQIGANVQDWVNGGIGALQFPPVHLAFAQSAPTVQVFQVNGASSATITYCNPVTLTARWVGPPTATIQPGAITIANGGSVSVTPGLGGTIYTLHVAGLSGITNSSNTVSVQANANTFATQPQEVRTCVGTTATFTVGLGSGVPGPILYEWFKEGNASPVRSQSTSSLSDTLTLANLLDTDDAVVYARVTCGQSMIESNHVALDVDARPVIRSVPSSVCGQGLAVIDCLVDGGLPLAWQIRNLDTNLVERQGSVAVGTTLPAPLAIPVTFTRLTNYRLELGNNACNPIATNPVVSSIINALHVSPISLTTDLPACYGVAAGTPLTLSVVASGPPTLQYEWLRNGHTVQAGPSNQLNLGVAGSNSVAVYRVRVTTTGAPCPSSTSRDCQVLLVTPPVLTATDGSTDAHVAVDWNVVSGATHYRVTRSNTSDSPGAPISGWLQTPPYLDVTATPGASYWYGVEATCNAQGVGVVESNRDEGWRALPVATALVASTNQLHHVRLNWSAPANAGFYRVYRSDGTATIPVSAWLPLPPPSVGQATVAASHEDWTADSSPAGAPLPPKSYTYWVESALDSQGTRASLRSASSTGSAFAASNLTTPSNAYLTGAEYGLVVLIDRSTHMQELRADSRTRWQWAIDYAKRDVRHFAASMSSCVGRGLVMVCSCQGAASSFSLHMHTKGFVDEATALAAIDTLPALPTAEPGLIGDGGLSAARALRSNFPSAPLSTPFCVPFTPINTTTSQWRMVSLLCAGENDGGWVVQGQPAVAWLGGCGFSPAETWQELLCGLLSTTVPAMLVRQFHSGTDVPPLGALPFADISSGARQPIQDSATVVPFTFFDDCNRNRISDDLDIRNRTSADVNSNQVPDECERDCNNNRVPDAYEIAQGQTPDLDADGIPDVCQGFRLFGPATPHADSRLRLVSGQGAPLEATVLTLGTTRGNWPLPCGTNAVLGIGDFHLFPQFFALSDATGRTIFDLDLPPNSTGYAPVFQALSWPTCGVTQVLPVVIH